MQSKVQIIMRLLPHTVSSALIAGTVYVGYALATTFRQQNPETPTAVSKPSTAPWNQTQNYQELLDRAIAAHIFGLAVANETTAAPPVTDANALGESAIQGIVYSKNTAESRVLLSSAQGTQILAVGTTTLKGYRITAINADSVIIEQSGRMVTVPYPQKYASANDRFQVLPFVRSASLSTARPIQAPIKGTTLERLRALREAVLKSMKPARKNKNNG
jgi:type II secretory pathway component PulC